MKNTDKNNLPISRKIEDLLPIEFENLEFNLNGWGQVDNFCKLNDVYFFLECEKGQKHPNTNVLKLFPYLEENPGIKIVLFHYFFPENKAPKNRVALCHFIGEKLEKEFGLRFQYVPLSCPLEEIAIELSKHDRKLIQAIHTRVKEGSLNK